ncbi:hypothetical protein BT96DRAFT_635632 [Gymnopus androsaceus JB14]|uniref:Histone H1 n=1 Tax=Gymnopus androsaceus JB14 TaxID=1447944 RepID=A0A6A4HSN7_9AGAR|nr:hypothetical protein BT96DRAFT_635632 [Gymnopus androsaceus JB14]
MSARKSASAFTKAAPKKGKTSTTHPPWIDMIKECIADHREHARTGVSRPQIKNYVANKYNLEVGAAQNTQLARAINSGTERNIFVLPKVPLDVSNLLPRLSPPNLLPRKRVSLRPRKLQPKPQRRSPQPRHQSQLRPPRRLLVPVPPHAPPLPKRLPKPQRQRRSQ